MKTSTREAYLEGINKAIYFIENNATSAIQLNDIATYAHLSPYHFHRIFKSVTGNTAKAFLTRLRLEKAAQQLKYSKQDIGRIALDCGYQHHETFTRAFKEYFGNVPAAYRVSASEQGEQKRQQYRQQSVSLSSLQVQGPVIKTLPDLHLAYIRHTGSYNKVGNAFRKLMLWSLGHLVLKLKPVTIGIVHDNPDLTADEDIRFDACVVVTKEINPKGEIAYKKIPKGRYAVFTYQGPYEGFYPVYDYIYEVCLFENKYELDDRPALEWYVKSPPFFKPEQFVTDFYLPIR